VKKSPDNSTKIKIVSSEYDEELDVIIWDIEYLEEASHDRIKTLQYRAKDLIRALGIKGELKIEHKRQFAEVMNGKVLNWESYSQESLPNVNSKNANGQIDLDPDYLHSNMKFYDDYPFEEAFIREQKNR
jgi:hypothetical protein